MDVGNKDCEFAVDISTSSSLLADQREIGDFLRTHYHRLRYLKITGDIPFRLDLDLTGSTIVNLKAVVPNDEVSSVPTVAAVMKFDIEEMDSWSDSDNSVELDVFDCTPHRPPFVLHHLDESDDYGYDSGYEVVFSPAC